MRISEYPLAESLHPNDLFICDGQKGTRVATTELLAKSLYELTAKDPVDTSLDVDKKILLFKDGHFYTINPSDMFFEFFDIFNSIRENKRSIRRNESLGNKVTRAQAEAIYNGTFDDLFIGDRWYFTGTDGKQIQCYLADINYATSYPSRNLGETSEQYPNIILFGDVYDSGSSSIDFVIPEGVPTNHLSSFNFRYWTPVEDVRNAIETVRAAFSEFSDLISPQDMNISFQPLVTNEAGETTIYGDYSGFGIVPTLSMIDDSFIPFIGKTNDASTKNLNYYMTHHMPMLSFFKDRGIMTLAHNYATKWCFSGAYGYMNCGSFRYQKKIETKTPYIDRFNVPIITSDKTRASVQYQNGCYYPLVFCIRGIKKKYYVL